VEVGDYLMNETRDWVRVTFASQFMATMPVYNITVQNHHNYLDNGILAHNKIFPSFMGFAKGGPVPFSGLFKLHGGEFVLSRRMVADMTQTLNSMAALVGAGAGAGAMARLMPALAGNAAGGPTVYQTFEGGLNFPNVRDGRDAVGVRRTLDRDALRASMTARVVG
jgi:hypothetical protein